MKTLATVSCLALGAAILIGPVEAHAQPRPEDAGYSCQTTPPSQAPIEGRFTGDYEAFFDDLRTASYVRCFTSVAACENWRYHVQSSEIFYHILYNECRPRT